MEAAIHRFVRLLRLHGIRVSVAETLDALHAAGQPGVLQDRETLRAALAVTLIKDRRDVQTFHRVFDAFFALLPVFGEEELEHTHEHDDLSDEGELQQFTLSDTPGDIPEQGHEHGPPDDIRDYFRPEDLAQQYNLHQEANKLDMSSSTDEIVLSPDTQTLQDKAARVQLSTRRLHNPGVPGELARTPGLTIDADLSVAQEMALLGWLADTEVLEELGDEEDPDLAVLRQRLAPLLERLPETLREHLQKLLASETEVEAREIEARQAELIDESERFAMEQSLRRILHSLRGSPRPRRSIATRGTVDGRRTMRGSMKYDGVPFRPVTVAKAEDRPRLVVLVDASLSVRNTARFTLHMVHSLQSIATSVRTFVFVDRVIEVTDVFAEHRIDDALSLIMAGLPEGGLIDVDADSDYGTAFAQFVEEFGSALTRRTTLLVLGDGRGNGHDPGMEAFEEMTRRARHTVWLTPEPSYSWGLGACDLPRYAEFCDRVDVARGLDTLQSVSTSMSERAL